MKETFKFNLKIDKTVRYLFIITAVLVGLSAFGSYYFGFLNNQNANTSFFVKLFDLNTEGNFPTLFSTLLLGFAALLLFLIFVKKRLLKEADKNYWIFLSAVFLFLALDESLQIHEKVTNIINLIGTDKEVSLISERPGFLKYVWVVPYFLCVVGVFIVLYQFLWRLPSVTRNLFLMGGIIFCCGAVGLEFLQGHYDTLMGQNNYTVVLYTIEEAMEMIGVIIFIYALLRYLSINQKEVQLNFRINFQPKKADVYQ